MAISVNFDGKLDEITKMYTSKKFKHHVTQSVSTKVHMTKNLRR